MANLHAQMFDRRECTPGIKLCNRSANRLFDCGKKL
jgi:hypothetical protein